MRTGFIILLLAIGFDIQAQRAPALLGAMLDHSHNGQAYNTSTGFNLEGWFGKHLSLNFTFLYSPTGPGQYYLYTGGGQAAGVYLIGKAVEERSGYALAVPLGIIAFVLPESYGFRVPVGNKSQIGIFLSPYGFEYMKNRNTEEEDYNLSIETGIRYYLQANRWIYLVPQVGVKSIYGEGKARVSFGLSLMFKTKQKIAED
ncbi:MAG: hypothetical protein DHS20C17_01020 [Cyclobacteriaceae bacterium]|nr:MAG: hypothetical protein DHS20C17_01020 [Cyclobacteriaceae bacterium]